MGEAPGRDWSVNATVTGGFPEVVSAVNSAIGSGLLAVMKLGFVIAAFPSAVVTVSATVYAPISL